MYMRILGALLLSAAALTHADSTPRTSTQLKIGDSSGGDRGLAAELARGYLQSRGGSDIQVIRRGSQMRVSGRIDGTSLRFAISSPRRETALIRLADGGLDLALTSGRAAADQRQRLAGSGGLLEEVAGLQALVLAVHPDNPVGAIDESSLRQLLRTGNGNWRDFGGEDAPIALTASDQLAEPLLQALAPAVTDRRDEASLELILQQNPLALALLPLQQADNYSKLAVTTGSTSLQPLPALIASEDYPCPGVCISMREMDGRILSWTNLSNSC
ncbi:substrate-binding domain-containing protein [Microbulbifer taiwanensis]|uniref:substrate-binding domain-containing protein n=1 Tax=Microbulbifer taiwanensis TaxID=986746 RepID=UPI00360868F6